MHYLSEYVNINSGSSEPDMPLWRNWQTHTTQNRTGNHMGSSPISGTIFLNHIKRIEKPRFYSLGFFIIKIIQLYQ